jgi:hypothetical protein
VDPEGMSGSSASREKDIVIGVGRGQGSTASRLLRLDAERCRVQHTESSWGRMAFYMGGGRGGDARFNVLYPDQFSEFDLGKVREVEILGISGFSAATSILRLERRRFVKALWIVHVEEDTRPCDDGAMYYRRGVAIVERSTWDEHALNGGKRGVVILG